MNFKDTYTSLQNIRFISKLSEKGKIPELESIDHGFLGINQTPSSLETFYHLKQIHSNIVVNADKLTLGKQEVEGDAIFCEQKGQKLAVFTADCVPILFHHPKVVAGSHGGWRGLVSGILENTITSLSLSTKERKNLKVLIGPAISPQKFEIGPEVVEKFLPFFEKKLSPFESGLLLTKGQADRWYLDLPLLSALICLKASILPENIYVLRSCTFSNPSLWYSYRRSNGNTGRIVSYISL